MAITFPAGARIVSSSMWLDTPGRRDTEDPFTGQIHRINYGGARWRGILSVGSSGRGDQAEQQLGLEIEAFLVDWVSGDEPAELPHGRPDFSDVLAASTTVSGWTGGIVSLNKDPSAQQPVGTTIRLGDRLYMVTKSDDVAEFDVRPLIDPGTGAAVGGGDTVLAMPDGDIELSFSRDFYGPWTLPWVEWLS